MPALNVVRIGPDPSRPGGASADAALRVPSIVTVMFQNFDLAGQEPQAAVVSDDGRLLAGPFDVVRYGGGACGKALMDCRDADLRSWVEGGGGLRIALHTVSEGWALFADVVPALLPDLTELEA